MYRIEKVTLTKDIMKRIIELSEMWVKEGISTGIVKNTKNDFVGKDIYVAYNKKNEIVAYLLSSSFTEKRQGITIPKKAKVCYIDEIYVMKYYRNKGIGTDLYNALYNDVKGKCDFIELSTSTKDTKRILNFYVNKLKMNFWSAMFYTKIS